jgi:GT2 family glycosyltransferase
LIVDNGSVDGAPSMIRARYPEFELIEIPVNRGWAGGNNVGIERALRDGAEMICLLNNDTIVPRGSIAALAHTAQSFPPCLMHPAIDYTDPAEGWQLDPSRSPGTAPATALGEDIYELDYAYGACLMVPAVLFRRIGMFDERFFLQLEEMDFYLRARRIGVRSLCATRVRIFHSESRSFGNRRTPIKTYYIARNSLLLMEKHDRSLAAARRSLRKLYWSISRAALHDEPGEAALPLIAWCRARNPFVAAARAGVRDYLLRRFGAIPESTVKALSS